MQDMQPDSVSPEELVREILRVNHNLVTCHNEGQDMAMKMCDLSGSENDDENSMVDQGSRICNNDQAQLRPEVIILDCQNPPEFQEAHIRGAVNVTFPAIMIRRIAAGKIDLFDKSKELKAKMANAKIIFVVYDSHNPSGGSGQELSDLVSMVAKKLAQNGCRVATLKGKAKPLPILYICYEIFRVQVQT